MTKPRTTDRPREIHGMSHSDEHTAWSCMKQRCSNSNRKDWSEYGGRGISVCDRWKNSFLSFLEDMGNRPSKLHSIDRIDVNGNYEPGNVRWATHLQQMTNTRKVRLVEINGKTQSVRAWEKEMKLSQGIVSQRLSRGWDVIEAITTKAVLGQKIHKNPSLAAAIAESEGD